MINRSLRTYDVGDIERKIKPRNMIRPAVYLSLGDIESNSRRMDGLVNQRYLQGLTELAADKKVSMQPDLCRKGPRAFWMLMQSDSIGTSVLSLFVRGSKCPTPPRPSDHPITQSPRPPIDLTLGYCRHGGMGFPPSKSVPWPTHPPAKLVPVQRDPGYLPLVSHLWMGKKRIKVLGRSNYSV